MVASIMGLLVLKKQEKIQKAKLMQIKEKSKPQNQLQPEAKSLTKKEKREQ